VRCSSRVVDYLHGHHSHHAKRHRCEVAGNRCRHRGRPIGQSVVITLKKDLTIDIQKENFPDFKAAADELRRIYSTKTDKTIFLRADAKIPFNKVVELIDICKAAGIETLGLVPEYFTE
jgi:biopolymer transport protein ExbD